MTTVRVATVTELPDVMNVLDGAVLEADAARVRDRIAEAAVLVAVAGDDSQRAPSASQTGGERVLGALVLDGDHIDAVAVRRRRRGQGIGTALVDAAASRTDGPLVARFRAGVRPFYDSLGFAIDPAPDDGAPSEADDRLRGVLR